MPDLNGRSDIGERLEALERELAASNPSLYRHLALYLQVLREVLPGRVEQACFHLATQVYPGRYAALPGLQRQQLHRRLQSLVHRCRSLLTVEQLAGLASQMERERQRHLTSGEGHLRARPDADGEPRQGGAGRPGPAAIPTPLPEGSIRLQMAPPLSPGFAGWQGLTPPSSPAGAAGLGMSLGGDAAEEEDLDPADDTMGPSPSEADSSAFLLSILGSALGGGPGGLGPGSQGMDPSGLPDLAGGEDPEEAEESDPDDGGEAAGPSLWLEGRLPREPLLLLRWLDGIERALSRRLRNLSHALNVEFLRLGISRTLLPVSLLDAVLAGRLETLAAPANLLRLQVPMGIPSFLASAEVVALLVRGTDLEMEEARLRTCRRRLQQHRQQVRRMARQYRRLQRRLQAQEAEQLWLQDTRTTRPNLRP